MTARKATALDVAKVAGVSRSAVSMVLNGNIKGNVSREAQERIRAAARELNYLPNPVAVSLRNQRTATLGIVTDEIVTSPFAGRLVSGATNAALARGYMILVVDTEHIPGRDELAIDALQHRRVDGLIYATGSLKPYSPTDPFRAQPAALANCFDPQDRLAAVVPDEVTGSRRATELLLELGHRRIALLGGDDENAALLREQGYRTAMENAGLSFRDQQVVVTGWDIDQGYRAAESVLQEPDRPTAVLAANDRVATGILLYAASAGIRVPEQLSVVGYDDQQNVAANLVPALTTVALPHAEIGAIAVNRVLDELEGGERRTERVLVPCPLITRQSTAPAA
ncbi:LacI family DNA-binding transcriptional regulator [Arthrobacter subterraneus]|uniref:LacI family DNA-binding transcriptional regulator n=1 Tax=Arthrobacter subterraneus TaxID=335973 RepID=UPI00382693F1